MKLLGWLARIVLALVIAAFAVYFGARLHDGPLGPIPGGPLQAGDWADPPSDWRFAADVKEIELQLDSQSISRTTWILVRDGTAWVPCSLGAPPGKSWYKLVSSATPATLRIDGKRYAVTLDKDDDPSLRDFARAEVTRKYGSVPPGTAGVLFFRIASRAR
jgi:hypothetical protein